MARKKFVIVMAAGSGTRMGADVPKQFIEIDGKAIRGRRMRFAHHLANRRTEPAIFAKINFRTKKTLHISLQ